MIFHTKKSDYPKDHNRSLHLMWCINCFYDSESTAQMVGKCFSVQASDWRLVIGLERKLHMQKKCKHNTTLLFITTHDHMALGARGKALHLPDYFLFRTSPHAPVTRQRSGEFVTLTLIHGVPLLTLLASYSYTPFTPSFHKRRRA